MITAAAVKILLKEENREVIILRGLCNGRNMCR